MHLSLPKPNKPSSLTMKKGLIRRESSNLTMGEVRSVRLKYDALYRNPNFRSVDLVN